MHPPNALKRIRFESTISCPYPTKLTFGARIATPLHPGTPTVALKASETPFAHLLQGNIQAVCSQQPSSSGQGSNGNNTANESSFQ